MWRIFVNMFSNKCFLYDVFFFVLRWGHTEKFKHLYPSWIGAILQAATTTTTLWAFTFYYFLFPTLSPCRLGAKTSSLFWKTINIASFKTFFVFCSSCSQQHFWSRNQTLVRRFLAKFPSRSPLLIKSEKRWSPWITNFQAFEARCLSVLSVNQFVHKQHIARKGHDFWKKKKKQTQKNTKGTGCAWTLCS